ncbi:hypothetical protein DFH08DRAFT_1073229 [Mycena albidolilacea]|uniref:F-box domain-containing protein n=1 Tax=Mycena albidolilacea TaxID=1033008 RepID=A0AAD7F4H7_9AGAR|nr:hypothetical protein DFH08DRAFT_1073229 [Mycena albidolilacea]
MLEPLGAIAAPIPNCKDSAPNTDLQLLSERAGWIDSVDEGDIDFEEVLDLLFPEVILGACLAPKPYADWRVANAGPALHLCLLLATVARTLDCTTEQGEAAITGTLAGTFSNLTPVSDPDSWWRYHHCVTPKLTGLSADVADVSELEVPSAEDSNAASPVLTLPPETVAESFFNFLPAYPEVPLYSRFRSPLFFCRIRRHWRVIALTTPALWKAISIVVCDRDTYQTQKHYRLDIYYNFPHRRLTHLEAHCLYEHEYIEILRDAPFLVACTLSLCCSDGELDVDEWPDVPVRMHLRTLILGANTPDGDTRMWLVFDRFTLPVLRTLEVMELSMTLDSHVAFVSRSQCSLDELRVTHSTLRESAYRDLLPSVGAISLDRQNTPEFSENS